MGAIADLWKSERGIVAIVSLALVTTVFQLGSITSDQWEALLKWIITGYTAAKTVTGTADLITRHRAAEPQPMPGSTGSATATGGAS